MKRYHKIKYRIAFDGNGRFWPQKKLPFDCDGFHCWQTIWNSKSKPGCVSDGYADIQDAIDVVEEDQKRMRSGEIIGVVEGVV